MRTTHKTNKIVKKNVDCSDRGILLLQKERKILTKISNFGASGTMNKGVLLINDLKITH